MAAGSRGRVGPGEVRVGRSYRLHPGAHLMDNVNKEKCEGPLECIVRRLQPSWAGRRP